MQLNRRSFLSGSIGAGLLTGVPANAAQDSALVKELEEVAKAPVLKRHLFADPVIIESFQVLKAGDYYYLRVASKDGAEGICLPTDRIEYLNPIMQHLVIPFFVGKDARDLDALIDGVYVHESNYKMSSLALWNCVAWVEFSILDMLGRIANKPMGELLGTVLRTQIPIYAASGTRGNTPENEIGRLQRLVEETGTKALKFKVGGRMSNDADSLPGRSEKLVALVRETFGKDMTLYADANGSYGVESAVAIGKLMEEHGYAFFEEPCPFDHLDETKQVADKLTMPVAGGEQESSQWRFRWMIANRGVEVVQPDLDYYGGYIRSTRVARMAAHTGMTITPHVTGGLAYVHLLHFSSCTPNIGAHQEYKGNVPTTGQWFDPPIRLEDGALSVPTAPGAGFAKIFDEWKQGTPVEA